MILTLSDSLLFFPFMRRLSALVADFGYRLEYEPGAGIRTVRNELLQERMQRARENLQDMAESLSD